MSIAATDAETCVASAPHVHLATLDGENVQQQHHIKLTTAPSAKSFHWDEQNHTLEDFEIRIANHIIREKKDGDCWVGATLLGGKRNLKSVDAVWVLTYDIDGSMSWDEVYALLDKHGYHSYLYTTHSHKTTRTEVVVDQYERWAKAAKQPTTPTLESLMEYLRATNKGHLKNPQYDKFKGFDRVADKGNCYIVNHDPVDKLRVVVLVETPINIGSLAPSNQKAIEIYKSIYFGVAEHLGLRDVDVSCSDPTRLFYFPSCPEDKKDLARSEGFGGKFIDWESVPRVEVAEKAANDNGRSSSAKEDVWYDGVNLSRSKLPPDFDIEALIETHLPDQIAMVRDDGGFSITCPFEREHTDAGGMGTFACNANDKHPAWNIYCSHGNSCQTAGRKRLDFVREWLEQGLITLEDLGLASACKPAMQEDVDSALAEMGDLATLDEIQTVIKMVATFASPLAAMATLKALEAKAPRTVTRKDLDAQYEFERKAAAKLEKAAESLRRQQNAAAAEADNDQLVAKLTDRFKWIFDANGYWDTVAGVMRPKEAVHSEILSDLEDSDLRASEALLLNTDSKFACIGYRPKGPETYENDHGLPTLNTYKPSTLQPMEGDASPIVEHIKYVFGKDGSADPEAQPADYDVAECNYFLDCLAFIAQNEDQRPLTATLIASLPGVGKGAIGRALKPIVGAHNYVEPTHNEISEGKNAYLERKRLCLVHEVYDVDDKRQIASVMKPLITETPIRVRKLYLDHYSIENVAWWLMFTNHYNALYVENNDRRYFVYHSRAKPRDEAYYEALYDWLDGDGPAIFYAWLLARDVSRFNPTAPAPMTEAKRDAIEASMGETAIDLQDCFREGHAPFNADLLNLAEALAHLREKRGLGKLSRAVLIKFIREQGGQQLSDQPTYFTTPQGTSGERRLWVLRDVEKWRAATPAEIGAELFKPMLSHHPKTAVPDRRG